MRRHITIDNDVSVAGRLRHLDWPLVGLLTLVACIGFTALYSAGGGSFSPWAWQQMSRFAFAACVMIVVAITDIRVWHRLAYPCYLAALVMLVYVEFKGHVGMGAQRWINLGFMKLQPSEVMKVGVVMALARYFHAGAPGDVRRLMYLVPPALMVLIPFGLVVAQPDLGTALKIGFVGTTVFFLAGAPAWLFVMGIAGGAALVPVVWHFIHDYQRRRILTFLDPESDPLGAGFHITQSKIALGSGGIGGKGFLNGTQSHLNFLPEKQTDFVFTLWAEEWGLLGGLFLLALYGLIFIYAGWIAFRCRNSFARLLAFGLMVNFSLYVLINVAMVMGLLPVVGVPLPLLSYGGTAMLSVLGGFGLIMSCHLYRDAKVPKL